MRSGVRFSQRPLPRVIRSPFFTHWSDLNTSGSKFRKAWEWHPQSLLASLRQRPMQPYLRAFITSPQAPFHSLSIPKVFSYMKYLQTSPSSLPIVAGPRRSKRLRTTKTPNLTKSPSQQSCSSHQRLEYGSPPSDSSSDFHPDSITSSDDEASDHHQSIHRPAIRKKSSKRRGTMPSSSPIPEFPTSTSPITSTSPETLLTPTKLTYLRTNLLDWYVDNYRVLPWRAPPRYRKNQPPLPLATPATPSSPGAPYAIWISEVMSQQTRLQVVTDYFIRWMKKFPTVQHLAAASLDAVNQQWSGLGYYRRARFLHEAAQQLVSEHDGELPSDMKSLLKIRGIGRYTAAAISSIAFGKQEAVVDGNVLRVLSRLCPALTRSQDFDKVVWTLSETCVEGVVCAGDFNQAIMELGAKVCKPKGVLCGECPVREMCGAYEEAKQLGVEAGGYVVKYPMKKIGAGVKVRDETVCALVVCGVDGKRRKMLVVKRAGDGLLAGLWETLNVVAEGEDETVQKKAVTKLCVIVKDVLGNDAVVAERDCVKVTNVRHVFSHIRQLLVVWLLKVELSEEEVDLLGEGVAGKMAVSYRWMSEDDIAVGAVSTQMKKVFASVLN